MTDTPSEEGAVAPTSNELAAQRTQLAVYRTTMAASRSLMAWVRTGLSMIGFGFTIYKFLEDVELALRPHTARNVGILLIALGTIAVAFGCVEYGLFARETRRTYAVHMRRFPIGIASAIGLLGLLLLVGIAVHAL